MPWGDYEHRGLTRDQFVVTTGRYLHFAGKGWEDLRWLKMEESIKKDILKLKIEIGVLLTLMYMYIITTLNLSQMSIPFTGNY